LNDIVFTNGQSSEVRGVKRKRIDVELKLPNGKRETFTISSNKSWQENLRTRISGYYPASEVRIVENFPKTQPSPAKPFQSGVMFEIRSNYYAYGFLIAGKPRE